jgi:hypothetical protein
MPKKMTEAEMIAHNEAYLASRGRDVVPTEWGKPRDQYWTLRRGWTGEAYFVRGSETNEWVQSQYNPLDALKDE